MKNIFYTMMLLVVFTACKKTNETLTGPADEKVPSTYSAAAPRMGNFMNGPHRTVTGTGSVYLHGGKHTLALGNAAISNGPNLHVYLAKEIEPIIFIDLGKLKPIAGNQVYDIAGEPDFTAINMH